MTASAPRNRPPFLSGLDYRTNQPVEVGIQEGRITFVNENEGIIDTDGLYIGPGLVDLQVNGFRGLGLNAPSLQVPEVKKLTEELWSVGGTTYFPTIFTNSSDCIR
jgi:N-acetylglucosamine-6-phosphate deacetylase